MNTNEEDLQKRIESGEAPSKNDLDMKSYQVVFRALKKEPSTTLSNSFEERIIELILEKRRKEARRDSFWFGFGIFLIVIAFIVALALTSFSLNFGFLAGMADYKGLAVFGILFITLLNWVDRRFIRPSTPI